jgi:hypothetical protein
MHFDNYVHCQMIMLRYVGVALLSQSFKRVARSVLSRRIDLA